ncbi:MAG: 30S ribosomal protein S11 [Chlamydiota bacterium]|nr:30S ribosomal protein S11 [Chlamydiota bacterium]
MAEEQKKTKKKITRTVTTGKVYVKATFNNTQVSITDTQGNVIAWCSSGVLGFRGAKKSTAYASQVVATDCAKKAMEYGLKVVEVFLKGPGAGRESAVRALQAAGLAVTSIKDITPIPHNGCRPSKRRRV